MSVPFRRRTSARAVLLVHGTEDPAVPFTEAETIRSAYERTGVAYEWNPLEGTGHGAWEVTIANPSRSPQPISSSRPSP